jgi:hypothetical protein
MAIRMAALLFADLCYRGCSSALGWLLCRELKIDWIEICEYYQTACS